MLSRLPERALLMFISLLLAYSSIAQQEVNSNVEYSKFTNKNKGVMYLYPSKWILQKKSGLIDMMLLDTSTAVRVSEEEILHSLAFYDIPALFFEPTDAFIELEEFIEQKRKKDGFKLLYKSFSVNKNRAKFLSIKYHDSINSKLLVFYDALFIRDLVKNDTYNISMHCPPQYEEQYDKLFAYICDNFSFIERVKPQKKAHSKKTDKRKPV